MTPAPSPVRGAGPMVLAVCGFAGLSLLYLDSARMPGLTGGPVADLAFLIPITLSAILCAVSYRRARGVEARFWLVATVLNVVLLGCEVYWLVLLVRLGSPP
ncbi:MAG TPA: hypothetical protein VIK83_03475, partial [Coriobacteriia bacterium]